MKTKILMVYPKIPSTFWSLDSILPYFKKKALLPPLGLLHIAAMLPDNYEVKLIDMNAKELRVEDILEADLVFVSAMSIQQESFEKVVKLCNDNNKTVVGGGPHMWSWQKWLKGVDHIIINEAELLLPEFLKDYAQGKAKAMYQSDIKPDITKVPPPRLDLINVNDYVSMPLQFSRGCPFNCEFCDIIEMFGRKVRTKEIEQFITELEGVRDSGFYGSIFVVDDNFVGNKSKTKALLTRLIAWQEENSYPFSLYTEASMNLAQDDELMDMMIKAGFNMVFIGIESPDPDTLTATQKNQNVREDLLESIKKIQSKGIMIMGGFIIGFDNDTEKVFDLQINFIMEAGIPIAMVGLLAAMPNTQLWRRLEREKRIIGDGHHTGNNVDICVNFIPKIPEKKLVEGYKRVISTLYTPKNWYGRFLNLLKHMPNTAPLRKTRIFPPDMPLWKKMILIKNYLRLIFKPIFSSYGLDFIRFVRMALKINKANSLPVIGLAISGFHYYNVAKRIVDSKYKSHDEVSEPESKMVKNSEKIIQSQSI